MPEPDPHAKVVRLVTAGDPQQAALWQQALEAEGIRCHVVGEYLGGMEGPPPGHLGPELWVREEDVSRATEALDQLRKHRPGTVGHSPNDHSRLAGGYLIVLGVLTLLTLNLGGLLLIWFGAKVQERHEGFRKATIWLLGLALLGGLGIVLWATLEGTERVTVMLLFDVIKAPPLWLVYVVAIPALLVYGLPLYWLSQDSYKRQAPEKLEQPTAG